MSAGLSIDPAVLDGLIRSAATRAAAGVVEALGAAIEVALRTPAVQQTLAETMAGWLQHGEATIGLRPAALPWVPPAKAVAAEPAFGTNSKLTEPRAELFRTLWPDRRLSSRVIMQRLNALPGPAYEHPAGMNTVAKRLGLPTDRAVYPWPGQATTQVAGPAAEPAPEAPRAAEVAQRGGPRPDRLTPAREACFRAHWPDPAKSVRWIMEAMNALPGTPYTGSTSMYSIAIRLGLPTKRPDPPPKTGPALPPEISQAAAVVLADDAEARQQRPEPPVARIASRAPNVPAPIAPILPPAVNLPRGMLDIHARQAAVEVTEQHTAPVDIEAVQDWYFAELLRHRKSAAEAEAIIAGLTPPKLLAAANAARDRHGLTRFVITTRQVRREADRHDAAA